MVYADADGVTDRSATALAERLSRETTVSTLSSAGTDIGAAIGMVLSGGMLCECVEIDLDGSGRSKLRCCSLEDIIAEKLRCLLQQVIRKRRRPQDVFDIARAVRARSDVDRKRIGEFLLKEVRGAADRGGEIML